MTANDPPKRSEDVYWLSKVERARTQPWSAELGLCMACSDRPDGCRLGVRAEAAEGDWLLASVVLGPEHEGGPGVAHGGTLAGVLDEVMGHCVMSRGLMVVTATLTIDYLKPAPINVELSATARVVGSSGRRWQIEGEIALASSGAIVTRGHGVWVTVPDGHYERHRTWLSTVNPAAARPTDR